jgi:hypothetical protein
VGSPADWTDWGIRSPDKTPHALRHTHATAMWEGGMQHPHGGASVLMPYLTYLSLVHGIGLDYPVLLARTFTSPFKLQARHGSLGVDAGLFDRQVQLVWPVGCCCTAATATRT